MISSTPSYSMVLHAVESEIAVKVDFLAIKKSALIIRALNHKLRQQIIKLINQEGRLTVTEIFNKLHIEQSVASQHLAILRRAGMVNTEREGKFIYYNINLSRIGQVVMCVNDLLK